jgi:signal transduction histidine kinase
VGPNLRGALRAQEGHANADDLGGVQLLAGELLRDVERLAERSAARMQEMLPAYAEVPRDELTPVLQANTRNLLEAIRDPGADPTRADAHYRTSGETRARQGITSDEMLNAWRIGLEVVREQAHATAEELGIGTDELLEFVVATLRWGDVGMRASASAHHEAEIRELGRLVEQQAGLQHVATLVARGGSPAEVFAKVAEQVGMLLGGEAAIIQRYEPEGDATVVGTWGKVGDAFRIGRRLELGGDTALVYRTGRPVRFEYDESATESITADGRQVGIRSAVGCPIVVCGRLWGWVGAGTFRGEPLPPETEAGLVEFCDLVAMAISNANARAEVERLADEQAALRRVATLIARESSPQDVFAKVAEEVGLLLGAEVAHIQRYEPDGGATVVGSWATADDPGLVEQQRTGSCRLGTRSELDGNSVTASVYRTERAARFDDYQHAAGSIAADARRLGIRSAAGGPIVAEARLWGAIVAATTRAEPLPADAESRIAQFTELVATAISNQEARGAVRRLAEEQAALRRVATLVAKESAPAELFAKVAQEAANVIGDVDCALLRDEGDGTASVVAAWGAGISARLAVGTRLPADGDGVTATVLRGGRPLRIDDYSAAASTVAEGAREHEIHSAVGCPIVVRGGVWGAIVVARFDAEPCPPETESRIAQFADLVATTIANAETHAEVERLAEEQAGLRRVAMLVAEGAPATAVFDAVAAGMEQVLGADGVTLCRYEPDDEVTVVARSASDPRRVPPGTRVSHRGENVTSLVRYSSRSARLEHRGGKPGAITEAVRNLGVRASVGAPIVVDGRLWGVAIANWRGEQSPPADTEERMVKFAELIDTAVANADSRDQLTASRARLVTEADEARRRVVRDLHDGAQQRLVHTIVTLKLAQQAFHENDDKAESLITEALEHAQRGNGELRELAHGILPAVLTQGGLRAGVDTIVARLDLPVDVDIPAERFPAEIEASAYFIVAEALTNVVKHAHARHAEVKASAEDGMLRVEVRDDGIGAADPSGHGLVGLADRVTALGGRLKVSSPAGSGTLLAATLPISAS